MPGSVKKAPEALYTFVRQRRTGDTLPTIDLDNVSAKAVDILIIVSLVSKEI
jgi:hypothetical protein